MSRAPVTPPAAPLRGACARTDGDRLVRLRLEAPGSVAVVPAGEWQAARPTGAYALVGCTVAPGFEFAGFRMLSDDPSAAAAFLRAHPDVADLL